MKSDRKLGALAAIAMACVLLCAATTVINLATQVSGTLLVGHGGTGQVTFTANCVLAGNGASALSEVCPSVAGQVLTDNGSAAAATFSPVEQFIDVNTNPFSIAPAAGPAVAYLDCFPGIGHSTGCDSGITIADGIVDGQILSIVCSSAYASAPNNAWGITGDFDSFGTLLLGGPNTASYDLGSTQVDSTATSCGAELMWSNVNGWWELLNLYGGTTS